MKYKIHLYEGKLIAMHTSFLRAKRKNDDTMTEISTKLSQFQTLYNNMVHVLRGIVKNRELQHKQIASQTGQSFHFKQSDIIAWLSIEERQWMNRADQLKSHIQELSNHFQHLHRIGIELSSSCQKCISAHSSMKLAVHLNDISVIINKVDCNIMGDLVQKFTESVDHYISAMDKMKDDLRQEEHNDVFSELATTDTSTLPYKSVLHDILVNAKEMKSSSLAVGTRETAAIDHSGMHV